MFSFLEIFCHTFSCPFLMVLKMGFRLPYLQIIRRLYVQVRFILTNFENHAAIHGKTHLCDVIFWNSPCVFAMRCGKNRTLFDSLPARQITRAGSACMDMIHRFKEGWIIWHPRGYLTNGNGPFMPRQAFWVALPQLTRRRSIDPMLS